MQRRPEGCSCSGGECLQTLHFTCWLRFVHVCAALCGGVWKPPCFWLRWSCLNYEGKRSVCKQQENCTDGKEQTKQVELWSFTSMYLLRSKLKHFSLMARLTTLFSAFDYVQSQNSKTHCSVCWFLILFFNI